MRHYSKYGFTTALQAAGGGGEDKLCHAAMTPIVVFLSLVLPHAVYNTLNSFLIKLDILI